MSNRGGTLALKRKRPGSDGRGLTADERAIYDLIKSKIDMGIWKGDIMKELNITNVRAVDNGIETLLQKKLIKGVPDVRVKGRKTLIAMEFEPSTELTGGVWYHEGLLDHDLLENLSRMCKTVISKQKVATADGILRTIKNSGVFKRDLMLDQVKQILDYLTLEKEILKVKSNGKGEFLAFPINSECYKLRPKQSKVGALASMPCGVCPLINQCAPVGIISPATCVYFAKWLEF